MKINCARSTSPLLRMADELPAEENWNNHMEEGHVSDNDIHIMPIAPLNLKLLG